MTTIKTFDTVGTSNLNGKIKVRYANGLAARSKVLAYHGHTDIQLFQLEEPMSKANAVTWLVENIDKVNPEAQEAVRAEHTKLTAPAPEKKVKKAATEEVAVEEAVAVEETVTEEAVDVVEETVTEEAVDVVEEAVDVVEETVTEE